jgi:integrase
MKLTASSIRALALLPGTSDKTFFDSILRGFGLRVRSGGATRWVVQYDIGGKTKRVTLGTTAMLNAGEAREKARDLLAAIRLGGDPAAEKREARMRAGETFGALLQRYLAYQRTRWRPRTYTLHERHLLKYARELHPRPLASIDRRTIAKLISELAEQIGGATAKFVRASLAQYFTWLVREGVLEANPVALTNIPTTNAARSRLINDEELRKIWSALGDDDYSSIVKLLVLTGARRDEIGGLSWDEVDLEAAEIRLPASRCKNKRPHLIVLSEPALAILAQRPRERAYVFGHGAFGFSGWSHCKEMLNARISGVPGFTLHDFRRLISTTMHDKLGIAPHVVESVLAHIGHQRGTAGVYNKALYLDERRRALERWAEYVTGVVTGEPAKAKVVNLRKR